MFRSCFSCVNCLRTLDFYTVYCGQDSEIYCKNCYQESFGTMSRRSRSRTKSRAQSRAASRSRRRSRSESIPNLDSIEGNTILADSMTNTSSIKLSCSPLSRPYLKQHFKTLQYNTTSQVTAVGSQVDLVLTLTQHFNPIFQNVLNRKTTKMETLLF